MSIAEVVEGGRKDFADAVSAEFGSESIDLQIRSYLDRFLGYVDSGKIFIYPHPRVLKVLSRKLPDDSVMVQIPNDFSPVRVSQTQRNNMLSAVVDAVEQVEGDINGYKLRKLGEKKAQFIKLLGDKNNPPN